jgi:DNA-binding response OmpR family regulator
MSIATENRVKSLRILIVEDRLETLQLIRATLVERGIDYIYTARDGREALQFLGEEEDRVDLVLCDWNMPRMTGLDLLRQIRTVDPHLPFLMITGRADADDIVAAKTYGVSAYIRKPFTGDELCKKITAIARVIAHRRPARLNGGRPSLLLG